MKLWVVLSFTLSSAAPWCCQSINQSVNQYVSMSINRLIDQCQSIDGCVHACTHTHIHIHTHSHARTHTHTLARAHAHTHTHTCTHTYTHTRKHAHTHTHTHTHTHVSAHVDLHVCNSSQKAKEMSTKQSRQSNIIYLVVLLTVNNYTYCEGTVRSQPLFRSVSMVSACGEHKIYWPLAGVCFTPNFNCDDLIGRSAWMTDSQEPSHRLPWEMGHSGHYWSSQMQHYERVSHNTYKNKCLLQEPKCSRRFWHANRFSVCETSSSTFEVVCPQTGQINT